MIGPHRRGRRITRALDIAAAILLVASCGGSTPGTTRSIPLTFVRDVPLPGPASRFDYQDVDPVAGRLYVAHLGASQVTVVDLATLTATATIPDIGGVHGIRAAPDRHRLFASATPYDLLIAVDTTTDTIVWRAPTGRFPDGVGYDQVDGTVYVSNKDDGSETVIDAASGSVLRTVPLADETGNVAADPVSGHVLVATHGPDGLVTLDGADSTIVSRTGLPGCHGAHGLYVDADDRLAFVACEDNDRVLVVDLTSGRPSTAKPTGGTPDVLAYDPQLRRLYVASESGVVSVFHQDGGTLTRLAQARLATHAHSVAVDPATHRVLFPLESVGGLPVLRVMQPGP